MSVKPVATPTHTSGQPSVAPPSAAALIDALSAPLDAADAQRQKVEKVIEKSLTVTTSKSSVKREVTASETNLSNRVLIALPKKDILAILRCYLRSPISDFLDLGNLLAFDIYKSTKLGLKGLGELNLSEGDFVTGLPFALTRAILALSECGEIATRFPPITLFVDYLKELDAKYIQNALNFLNDPRVLEVPKKKGVALNKKMAQSLSALRAKKVKEVQDHLKHAQDSVRALLTILAQPNNAAHFKAFSFEIFKKYAPLFEECAGMGNDATNAELCAAELASYAEMMATGIEDLSKRDGRFVKHDLAKFKMAMQLLIKNKENWKAVNSVKTVILVEIVKASQRGLSHFLNTDKASNLEEDGEAFLIYLQSAQGNHCTIFLLDVQKIVDLLIVHPAFPGFIPQETHYINLLNRCDLFCDVVKRRGNSSAATEHADQLVFLAIKEKETFLMLMGEIQRLSKPGQNFRLAFGLYCMAFASVRPQLDQTLLPALDRFRNELLAKAESVLRQKSLGELTGQRMLLEKALLPIYAPDIEDLCHFILYIKRYDNFMTIAPPEVTKEEHYFVPIELINYLVLDGFDALYDRIVAEKSKPATAPTKTAEPAPKVPPVAAPAAAEVPSAPLKIARGDKFQAVLRRLEQMGYEIKRQTGSHLILARLQEVGENSVVLPRHKQFKPGTAKSIENQANQQG